MNTILFKNATTWGLVILLVATASPTFAQSRQPVKGIQGQKAPEWDVEKWHQLPDGKQKLDVENYEGKVLYLYFFQSWCPGCHKYGFPTLQKLHKQFEEDEQVEFVVIQTTFEGHKTNTAAKLKPVAEKYKLPIPFGQSRGDAGTPDIMRKYRTGGTPWVVVIDKQGTVKFNDFHIAPDDAAKLIDSLK